MAIDLDAARAARREARGDAPTLVLGGKSYELPAELPYSILEALRDGHEGDASSAVTMTAMAQALLGKHYETLRSKLSVDDLNYLVEAAMKEYGASNPLGSSAS